MDLFPLSHSRLITQVSLSDKKLTLVQHKISQPKYLVFVLFTNGSFVIL